MAARGLAGTRNAALLTAGTLAAVLLSAPASAQPLVVVTGAATAVGPSTATLNGTVTCSSCSGRFEFGETTAYGQQSSYLDFGMNAADKPVSATIGNLTCNTTYHYRLVASAPGMGWGYGQDATFTTLGCATVSGVVTSATTGLPLANVSIGVFDRVQRTTLAFTATDATGAYAATGPLPTGDYTVYTWNDQGFVDELYDDRPCPGGTCDFVADATPVAVVAGGTVSGIDFALAPTARISGVVTDASTGLPLAGVFVGADGTPATAFSDAAGAYTLDQQIPAGSYRVVANGLPVGYISEVYDDHPCDELGDCSAAPADLVSVTAGATTAGIDFALQRGGRVTGRITDPGGQPIPFVTVKAYSLSGAEIGSSYGSDASGNYEVRGQLVTGSYRLVTSNAYGYIDRVYGGSACVGVLCDVSSGSPVSVTVAQTTSGIDFVLQKGGTISGTVTDAATGDPIVGGGVKVEVYDALGRKADEYDTNAEGYATQAGLPAGSYFVRTSGNDFYIDELHSGIPCVAGACTPADGTPVAVELAATTTGIDFALERSGTIAGVVRGPNANEYLQGVQVLIHDAAGALLFTLTTDKYGEYSQPIHLPPGTYRVRTSGATGYVDELYDDIPCPEGACTVTSGTPIVLAAGATSTVSFVLAQTGGRIGGTVTESGSGQPIAGVTVKVWHDEGNLLASAVTGDDGAYLVERVPAGYRYVTTESAAFKDELYDDYPCEPSCEIGGGTALVLANAQTVSGIDFALVRVVGRIAGQVTGAGGPLEGVNVRVYEADGNLAASASTGADGSYLATVPPGVYRVATAGSTTHIDELYDDQPCPLGNCVVASGSAVTVVADQTTADVSFVLAESIPVAGTVVDDATASGIEGVTVTLHDDTGAAVASAVTEADGAYRIRAVLPAGNSFVATSNTLGYVDEVHLDRACRPGDCTVTSGTAVAIAPGATATVDFGLALAGSLYTVAPCRLIDTRDPALGGPAPLAAGSEAVFTLAGQCGIPDDATALALNVTATAATSVGHLRLYPADQARPNVSAINFTAGLTRANNAVIPLSPDGRLAIYGGQPAGTVHVILDVSGYFR